MKSEIHLGGRKPCPAACRIHPIDAPAHDSLGAEGGRTRFLVRASREDRQNAITDEFQHIASRFVDGGNHGACVVVQERDDLVGRGSIGDGCVAPQIREPEHCVDAIRNTTGDAPVKNPLARIPAQVGLDQRRGDPCQRYAFDGERQSRPQLPQALYVAVAEAAGRIGHPG